MATGLLQIIDLYTEVTAIRMNLSYSKDAYVLSLCSVTKALGYTLPMYMYSWV